MEKDIALALTGFVVGGMNAVAGGGMLIGFPIMIALGVPPLVANATGNIVTAPGQLSSALGYRRYLRRVPLGYLWLAIPITLGSILGALTLRYTSATHFARLVPMLVLFGVGLFAFQPLLHFHLHRHMSGRARTILPLVLLGLALLPLSYYGGYFGAGYGFIMLAFLGFTSLTDAHMMNAMKNIAATFVSASSVVCLLGAHLINWQVGGIMAIGTVSGGFFGAKAAQKIPNHALRLCIIAVGLFAVVYLGFREY